MRSLQLVAASSALVFTLACGSDSDSPGTTGSGGSTNGNGGNGTGASGTGASGTGASGTGASGTGASGTGGNGTGASGTGGNGTGANGTGGNGAPSAAELLAVLGACNAVSSGDYKTDDEPNLPEAIPICGLVGAVYWQADMDIDCDGKETAQCNLQTDPAYQDQTAAVDSNGDPLDAAQLPYVVIPSPGPNYDFTNADIDMGSVVAVIYQGQVSYGVLGDTGPDNIIGEASYAMAQTLGIDPDPSTGGAETGVTYIVFTGASGVVAPIEDHGVATQVGEARAAQLLQDN